jgi:hypothetical protein
MQNGVISTGDEITNIVGKFEIADKIVNLLASGKFVLAPCFRMKEDGDIEIIEISVVAHQSAQQGVAAEKASDTLQSIECGNCGVYRTVENGVIQR